MTRSPFVIGVLKRRRDVSMDKFVIDIETFKASLRYDPKTGKFYRLKKNINPNPDGSCGTIGHSGARMIKYGGISYYASHLAWFYMTGSFPPVNMTVWYKNDKPSDTRFKNLYLITKVARNAKRAAFARKTDLPRGVTARRDNPRTSNIRYIATIDCCKKRIHLGSFSTVASAKKAYDTANQELQDHSRITVYRKGKPVQLSFQPEE